MSATGSKRRILKKIGVERRSARGHLHGPLSRSKLAICAQRRPAPSPQEPLSLRGMDLAGHLADSSRRQHFVTRMFDIIAPRYDVFTRVFSYWMDAAWKRELLSSLPPLRAGDAAIDLACGTGDFAFAIADRAPEASVTGIDASQRMLGEARQRATGSRACPSRSTFAAADMTALPLATASVRVLTAGYGFRNVPDLHAAITEAARVLVPDGTLLVLDFYRPRSAVWRALFLGYLRAAGNVVGWLWHGEAVVYGYIAPSIAMYMDATAFAHELKRAGFTSVSISEKLFGGVALHVATKGTAP